MFILLSFRGTIDVRLLIAGFLCRTLIVTKKKKFTIIDCVISSKFAVALCVAESALYVSDAMHTHAQ